MAFKQGRKPALVLRTATERKKFRGALLSAGYEFHSGPRTTRDGEQQAWVADIGRGRQVHVQEVKRRNGTVAVFAHTEPAGYGLHHLVSALTDGASYSGGSRVLKADLRARGWKV